MRVTPDVNVNSGKLNFNILVKEAERHKRENDIIKSGSL